MLRQCNMWAIGRIRWVVNSGDAMMLKLGKGLSLFPFPPIPRDVATSEAARFLCLCDRSELENGRADGAGTDFDLSLIHISEPTRPY